MKDKGYKWFFLYDERTLVASIRLNDRIADVGGKEAFNSSFDGVLTVAVKCSKNVWEYWYKFGLKYQSDYILKTFL